MERNRLLSTKYPGEAYAWVMRKYGIHIPSQNNENQGDHDITPLIILSEGISRPSYIIIPLPQHVSGRP